MQRFKYGIGILAAILAWLAFSSVSARDSGHLPLAVDLSKQAKIAHEKQVPVMILFSSEGCYYCTQVREDYLIPMLREGSYSDKVIVLEIDYSSNAKLVDFNGKVTTHAQYANRHRVQFTPTVKFFDPQGKEASDPVIGLSIADYYWGYLAQGIDKATAKIRSTRVTAMVNSH